MYRALRLVVRTSLFCSYPLLPLLLKCGETCGRKCGLRVWRRSLAAGRLETPDDDAPLSAPGARSRASGGCAAGDRTGDAGRDTAEFHTRGFAFLALAGVALAIAGCGASGDASSGGVAAAPASLSVDAILTKARSAALKDGSGTEEVDSKSAVTSITMRGTFQLTTSPSRYAFNGTSTSTVNGTTRQRPLNAVYIDTDMYSESGGVWDKTPMGANTSGMNYDPGKTLATMAQAQLVGVENVNGISAYHLKGVFSAPTTAPGSGITISPTTVDIWVRQDNFYPAQAKYHLTSMYPSPITNKLETIDTTITQIFTRWDSGISIALPQV